MAEKQWAYALSATADIAQALLDELGEARILLLEGELGAGKTTLVQALVAALGAKQQVTSPTYTIVNEYMGAEGLIYHFDLYRLNSAEELEAIGFAEYLDSGHYCLIEWPALAAPFLAGQSVARLAIKVLEGGSRRALQLYV
jgi:tRNA threonylcarbamoyladenosine biosynthesis protein TsaE